MTIDGAHLLNSTDSFDDFLWDASRGEIPDVRLAMEGLVEFHRGPGDTTNCNHLAQQNGHALCPADGPSAQGAQETHGHRKDLRQATDEAQSHGDQQLHLANMVQAIEDEAEKGRLQPELHHVFQEDLGDGG